MTFRGLLDFEPVIPIRFNPWRFTDESQLLKNFFQVLAHTLDKKLTKTGEDIGKFLNKYADALGAISYAGFSLKDAGKVFSKSAADLDELKKRIEEYLKKSKHRIVMIMDDIDRLDKQEIQAVFKLVKLSADFPNVSYLLAFDEEMVALALSEKYGSESAGKKFLEKIIQVPLYLPPANKVDLREVAFEGVDVALKLAQIELSEKEARRFVNTFVSSFEIRLKNPRQIKQYATALSFALPLLKGEVNTVDLLLIEAVRIFFPNLYSVIKNEEECFLASGIEWGFDKLKAEAKAKAKIETVLSDLSAEDKNAAGKVLTELFPKIAFVFGGHYYGSDWQDSWAKNARICSSSYFHRYFAYGIPTKDISDQKVAALLLQARDASSEAIAEELRNLSSKDRGSTVLDKLRVKSDQIDSVVAKILALALAHSADIFPNNDGGFGIGIGSSLCLASEFLGELLLKIEPEAERESAAIEIAKAISSLPFAYEYYNTINQNPDESDPNDKRTIGTECAKDVLKLFVARIKEEATQGSLFDKYPNDVMKFFWMWFGEDPTSIREFLHTQFTNIPEESVKFLKRMIDTHRQEKSYKNLCNLVDPAIVRIAVSKVIPDLANTEVSVDESWEKRAAKIFCHLHDQRRQLLPDQTAT